MSEKSQLLAYMTMAQMAILTEDYSKYAGFKGRMSISPESKEGLEFLRKQQEANSKIPPKGCKEFTIDGITVFALNEKNAIKKVDKIKSSNQ